MVLSCKNDPDLALSQKEDPNWIKLEIPNGREAFSIAGSIDDILLVSTWMNAYYSIDKGKTWQESKNFQGPVPGFLTRNDTVLALEGTFRYFDSTVDYASIPRYFSPDYGKTWDHYLKYYSDKDLLMEIGTVNYNESISYKLKWNITYLPNNSNAYYRKASRILKNDGMNEGELNFPFVKELHGLHLDKKGRLYVAASSGEYNPKTNSNSCCSPDSPAIIYISKKPLP